MRHIIIGPIAAMFVCCLALTLPLRAAAGITTASCPQGKATMMGDNWGCVIPLNVSQPGHKGGAGPSDWGMCGVFSVSGDFGPPTVARIIVQKNGEYAAELIGHTIAVIPKMELTCVLFKDFIGTPSVSDASAFDPPSGNGVIAGSVGNACIWAGLSGNITSITNPTSGVVIQGQASAEYYGPETVMVSQYAKSYAFCSGYTSASWKAWKYYSMGYKFYSPPAAIPSIGLDNANYWCYMDGLLVDINQGTEGPISAGLTLSGGNYGIAKLTPTTPGFLMGFNCLLRKQ